MYKNSVKTECQAVALSARAWVQRLLLSLPSRLRLWNSEIGAPGGKCQILHLMSLKIDWQAFTMRPDLEKENNLLTQQIFLANLNIPEKGQLYIFFYNSKKKHYKYLQKLQTDSNIA